MKNRFLILALICLSFLSCQKKEEPKIMEDVLPPKEAMIPNKVCYQYAQGKDTIVATLTLQSGNLRGNLAYRFFEKDKSNGTLVGTVLGDTLIADYTFMSEGATSVRQVAFLRKDNSLIEGYGDIEEKNGKMIFKDIKKLNFSGTVLHEIPCK